MNEEHKRARQRTYQTWQGMKQRCYNQKCANYPHYGGRGIFVCDRWLSSFDAFMADMGVRPEGLTIDRIDVNGSYEPGNCRWADRAVQRRNQRDCLIIEHDGKTMTAEEWGRLVGIDPQTIRDRHARGMRGDRLLNPKPIRSRPRPKNPDSGLAPEYESPADELSYIREQLSYNPHTGEMNWISQRSRNKVGAPAGSRDKANGKKVRCNNKFYAFHRLAWALHYGSWPTTNITHANGDKMDNRIINLAARAAGSHDGR